ncbi:Putative monooxygenase Rv0793 [Planktothrix tepida]|uniref:Antibiotic biosynthesis monooxygenase n=2 Tax=Planktothrix TaxID=54304 RepID=A0A1J1LGR2_9CYAN|nr:MULTISPECIES: putative quinol monooxygenase [Planktothrix]CAD5923347.1 Putative monooxygenase Rv0793 [Planktothrix tepida]CAD5982303.1 Putative monooxygenase Rv0793 [Planktothrix pseudagardhii]CUR31100.1 Antibiotic biosynthesis monooxygenase [Planktothrix tepida PCC 9214]
MTQPLKVIARVVALPDKIEPLKAVLLALVEPTRQESGCLQYDLLQNQEDLTDFTFVEEWESLQHLQNHLASVHIQTALTQIEGLVASPPDIRCYDKIL